jgi:hypothetical protein
VAAITVSHREVEGSPLEDEVRCLATVLEIAVWGESRWGHSVFGSLADADRLEGVLSVLSNGAFLILGSANTCPLVSAGSSGRHDSFGPSPFGRRSFQRGVANGSKPSMKHVS